MVLSSSTHLALGILAASIAGMVACAPPRSAEERKAAPELRLEGVRFRLFRGDVQSASGTAAVVTYLRETTALRATELALHLRDRGEELLVTAPSGEGVVSSRTFAASGGVRADRGPDPAAREPAPKRPPVHVDAEEVRYSYKERTITFVGRPTVKLTREDAVLLCTQVVAENDAEGKIARATCTGDVKLVRGARTVTCDSALFVEATALVTCRSAPGRPVSMVDGPSTVTGQELIYDLDRDLVTLRGQVVGDIVPPGKLTPPRKEGTR
jgi:lipopolysaccharide export system protein LptA